MSYCDLLRSSDTRINRFMDFRLKPGMKMEVTKNNLFWSENELGFGVLDGTPLAKKFKVYPSPREIYKCVARVLDSLFMCDTNTIQKVLFPSGNGITKRYSSESCAKT